MANEGLVGGATSGAATGATIGGPWGALFGAAIGGVYGYAQDEKAEQAKAEAEKLAKSVPNVDPRMLSHLQDIELKQKYLAAGTSSEFQIGKRNIDQINATTGSNLARTTGGNSAALIDALLGSERQADSKLNELTSDLATQGIGMMNMKTPIISDMADRTLSLQLASADRAASYAAELQRDNQANMYAGISALPSIYKNREPRDLDPATMDAYTAPQRQPVAQMSYQRPDLSYAPNMRSMQTSSDMLLDASQPPQAMQPLYTQYAQPDLSYAYAQ